MNLVGRRYGHIRVERMLGQGGMGAVYEGVDEKLERRVALKVLDHPNVRLDAEARTRLTREARTLGRLDHPNICRIYDFIDGDDADVLVLELIDGRTLQQALREGLSHVDKLRIAHSIAEVLVVAHRAGILHRDLKPENVMLTKTGEVKVLDFGLARWLERERRGSSKHMKAVSPAELAAQMRVTESEVERWYALDIDATAVIKTPPADVLLADATAAGITVGTPLYMSPEQARGETLTTASDIYSFGLLLQTLFTERDPYPEGITAREVMMKAARGDSLPVNGNIPRNVSALLRSLKAFAPADRPTAVDTLRRIRYIVDSPKRYARRALLAFAIVVVVFGAWKYVTDLRRERAAAQQAEAEARRRRAQADSLIEFMLGDLRTKLEPVGRLDILDAAAERSLAYMSSLRTEYMTPEEIARNSKALNQLGEVRMAQANLAAALRVFKQSLAFAKQAAVRDANNSDIALAVATAHFWVGNALRLKGDLPGALAEMREYKRITQELAARYPSNDEYQVERAFGVGGVATILEAQEQFADAAREYQLALDVKNEALSRNPNDPKRRADVAVSLNKLGFVFERLGRLTQARDYYQSEFVIYEALSREDAKDMHWKERVANSHDYLAGVSILLGDVASARVHHEAAVAGYRDLVARDPTNARWRRNLAISLVRHSHDVGGSAALAELAQAESVAKELTVTDATRASWRRDYVSIETAYARALLATGNIAAAKIKADAALATIGDMHGSSTGQFADVWITAGDVAAALGNQPGATVLWQTAYDGLAKRANAGDARTLAFIATALIRLGRTADAQTFVDRLHGMGYREAEFERLLQHRS